MNKKLVSVIIPIGGSDVFLEQCLKSIRSQTYPQIEILLVTNQPTQKLLALAKKFRAKLLLFSAPVKKGKFDAPYKRNYGVSKAAGEFIYYLDSDMTLPRTIISEAAALCREEYDALVLSEDSFGEGIWAAAKQLERRCYWGDNTVEAARFFKKRTWQALGGLDVNLGGGGDDWDLHQRLLSKGYKVGRTKRKVKHNEGRLGLIKLMKKRFMYGRDSIKYLLKKPRQSFVNYFPIRASYYRNWKLFAKKPLVTAAFLVMRVAEYTAGFAGIVYSFFDRHD